MVSIALIGADGAGKTTLSKMLLERFPLPLKYIYMGINIESSNIALPTSRLINYLKNLRKKKNDSHFGNNSKTNLYIENKKPKSNIRAGARFINRFTEEWYRQFISWFYQIRGVAVLYDRHFIFDFYLSENNQKIFDRLHNWCLANLYPKPRLVIFLDAPEELLYDRKREATLQYLRSRRKAFNQIGQSMENFVKIDASQPLDAVYNNICSQILFYLKNIYNPKEYEQFKIKFEKHSIYYE